MHVKDTLHNLLKVLLRDKFPFKGEADIAKMLYLMVNIMPANAHQASLLLLGGAPSQVLGMKIADDAFGSGPSMRAIFDALNNHLVA